MLDGLDEISDPHQRIKACDWIEHIVTGFEPLLLWMQEDLEKDEADKALMQAEMQKLLKTLHEPPSVEDFCDNLIDRTGLVVVYGDKEYRFLHKSFQKIHGWLAA